MKKTAMRVFVISLVMISVLLSGTGCDLTSDVTTSPDSPEATDNLTPADNGELKPTEGVTPVDSDWTVPDTGSQPQVLQSIADVVIGVKPSVVAINTEVITRDFFNRPSTQEGAGSGWIISADGIIVTNNHVIEGAESITITLDDGRALPAQVVGADELTDLAVIKIEAENLPAVEVGDSSKMRIGDWVVAIGNSLGLGIRATQGIVSRQDVSVPVDRGQTLYGLIETDAAINPGNSGGPLVNLAGEVIGITNVKLTAVEVEGTGYAISTEAAMPIIQQLINTGHVIHPWLGVSLYSVDQFVIQEFGLSVEEGVFVVEVVNGSPADIAGLRPEDVVVGFDGGDVEIVDDLIRAIRAARVGQEVEIVYVRGSERITTTATLIERP